MHRLITVPCHCRNFTVTEYHCWSLSCDVMWPAHWWRDHSEMIMWPLWNGHVTHTLIMWPLWNGHVTRTLIMWSLWNGHVTRTLIMWPLCNGHVYMHRQWLGHAGAHGACQRLHNNIMLLVGVILHQTRSGICWRMLPPHFQSYTHMGCISFLPLPI